MTDIPFENWSARRGIDHQPPRNKQRQAQTEARSHIPEQDRILPPEETPPVNPGPAVGFRLSERNPDEFPLSREMENELKKVISGEVRFDRGSRALYATDASNYRQVPIGVVVPLSKEDIIQTVQIAKRFGAPILSRGGGTSLAGQCCNTAVVMDMSKYYNQILQIDAEKKLVRVQPGIVLDELRKALKPYQLTFGPDPATHNHCTIGGMIGNNSCGMHAQYAGRTEHNVESLEILTYDGLHMTVGRTSQSQYQEILRQGGRRAEIYRSLRELSEKYELQIRARFPKIPRKVSGYYLDELLPENEFNLARALVGTESTCVTVLEATLNLVPDPPCRVLLVLGYPSIDVAGDAVPVVLKSKPIALEGIDDRLVEFMRLKDLRRSDLQILPKGRSWLVVEFGAGTLKEAELQAQQCAQAVQETPQPPEVKILSDQAEQHRIWSVREAGLGATARVPGMPEAWEGWEDSAVPPDKVGDYLRELRKLLDKYGYEGALYGHFGQGCIHTRISFDLETAPGIKKYREFIYEAAHLCVKFGGSLSGEHGDGQSRGELLPIMFGDELVNGFREFKYIWDPFGKMNPGKVVDPYRADQNLRLGRNYDPPDWKTHFSYKEDQGSFAKVTTRCVGVGECRRHEGGVMCPSYMVTREEMHSTRGRAHLLFEMLEGNPLERNWREEKVREALDLCLACKGCKSDCPVNVDMATYKSEFMAHYYERRLRPRAAYAMGLIRTWAGLAAHAPRLVNAVTQSPGISSLLKVLGGIAPERQMPRFAEHTFREWHSQRKSVVNEFGPQVILWVDTFTNHFNPAIGQAALQVLEEGGYRVELSPAKLCCGRPLYDFGFLTQAKRQLTQIVSQLKTEIQEGVQVIGLEPSCTAVFRDELKNLLPNDWNAKRLSKQTFLFSEFVEQNHDRFRFPKLARKAVVHGHCHQKSVIGMQADLQVLARLGVEFELLDSGCCGMAGSFGFEKDHYAVSKACGERVLLPAFRKAASNGDLLIANGFSCQEQIIQEASLKPLHIAEVMKMAYESVVRSGHE